jgi:hypothetical protein
MHYLSIPDRSIALSCFIILRKTVYFRVTYASAERVCDYDMRQFLRFGFSLDPTNNAERCACDADLTSDPAQACNYCTETRHDLVVQATYNVLTMSGGISVDIDGQRQPRLGPDLTIDGEEAFADVVVSTPTCQTYIDLHSNERGTVAANHNAQRMVEQRSAKFYSLVFESYGSWSKHVLNFFQNMATKVVDRSCGGLITREFLSIVRRTGSIALVRGHGWLVRKCVQMATRTGARLPPRMHIPAVATALLR